MVEKEQELIARVLDLFAQRFDKHAVLRGGMVLRILGSPRFTNDLDYTFVPFESKKDIVSDIVQCLETIEGAEVSHSLNSKCFRAVVTVDGVTIQVEAKVAMKVRTAVASTRLFSRQFSLPPRMVCISEQSVALANKLAAWNERRLIRDIYDIWFHLRMGVVPDVETLEARLRKPDYSRLVVEEERFPGGSVAKFYDFLRDRVSVMTDEEIAAAMADYLPSEEIEGLAMQFRAALVRLR